MAETVTVDAKPKPQLPYDPNDIPPAVKARVEKVENYYKQLAESQQPEPLSAPEVKSEVSNSAVAPTPEHQLSLPLADEPVPQEVKAPQPTIPPPPAEQRPAEDENSGSWKLRFERMQGRYTASQKQIGELQEQMTQLGNEYVHLQNRAQQALPPQQPDRRYITEKDVQDYGTDLVDFTQRAAIDAVGPKFQQIEAQNQELQRRLAQEARARLDMRVEAAVPEFREIDRDPRWHRWLLGIDMLSGRVRQTLLNEAIASADAPRAISFFRGFLNEEVATGHNEPAPVSHQAAPPREAAINLGSLAAPGRARPATGGDASVPPDRPMYTRVQIAQLYSAHRRGAYAGREAEWNRQEADIFAAGREGRVR